MSYDDETLMAFADGELDAATRTAIIAAAAQDPELAARVAQFRAQRVQVADAYSGLLDQPVPERLRTAARAPVSGADNSAKSRGNVVQFPSRGSPSPGLRWRAREWTAMAASLVIGGLIAWQLLASSAGDMATRDGALVARGELAKALDVQLAGDQGADAAVRIGLSFKSRTGEYCRSFAASAVSLSGLACREQGEWHIKATDSLVESAGLRQASSPAMLQIIEAHIAGEPLDAAAERSARDAGWR